MELEEDERDEFHEGVADYPEGHDGHVGDGMAAVDEEEIWFKGMTGP